MKEMATVKKRRMEITNIAKQPGEHPK